MVKYLSIKDRATLLKELTKQQKKVGSTHLMEELSDKYEYYALY